MAFLLRAFFMCLTFKRKLCYDERMDKRAEKLLELLDEHVLVQDYAGTHYGTAANNGYRNLSEEKEACAELAVMQKDLMIMCDEEGFTYALLLDLIPPSFKTNNAQRIAILHDLRQYAEKHHG